jgi:CRP/FNR family transcriptional regulator
MKNLKESCNTDRCTLCKLCLPGWKTAVKIHRKNFTYNRGEMLFKEGDQLEGVFYIHEGQAKIHKKWGEDKELIMRFASDGEMVGHQGLGLDSLYPISATALTRLSVCFFPIQFFMDSIEANHDFAKDLLWFFAAELKRTEQRLHKIMVVPVKNRLANTLQRLQDKFGVDDNGCLNLHITKTDIAAFCGVTYETIFRTLQEMESEGLIELDAKNIRLKNPEGLQLLSLEKGIP